MDNTIERISTMKREEVLEAVLALKSEIDVADESPSGEAQDFLREVESSPYGSLEDVEEVARAFLIVASQDPNYRDRVRNIVQATGQKAFILGGAEIVIVAGLAVVALQVWLSKGRTAEERVCTVGQDAEGNPRLHCSERISYGISDSAAKLLSALTGESPTV